MSALPSKAVETFFIVAFCDCGWPTTRKVGDAHYSHKADPSWLSPRAS